MTFIIVLFFFLPYFPCSSCTDIIARRSATIAPETPLKRCRDRPRFSAYVGVGGAAGEDGVYACVAGEVIDGRAEGREENGERNSEETTKTLRGRGHCSRPEKGGKKRKKGGIDIAQRIVSFRCRYMAATVGGVCVMDCIVRTHTHRILCRGDSTKAFGFSVSCKSYDTHIRTHMLEIHA